MILSLLQKSWKPLMFIALVSITITWIFNIQNTMITTEYIDGIKIWRFNLRTYMESISNAASSYALNFKDILPPVQWRELPSNPVSTDFWEAVLNNMAFLLDWIYFPINFILYIVRWICWLLNLLLTIIGWNTMKDSNGNYYSTLAQIINWITQNLMIPYVNPN